MKEVPIGTSFKPCTKCGGERFRNTTSPWCSICNKIAQHSFTQRCLASGLCTSCAKPRDANRLDKRTCQACEDRRSVNAIRRRKIAKKWAIDLLGGKCADCALTTDRYEVYDFHHIDPSVKEHNIGTMLLSYGDLAKVEAELQKCILLCSNCHRIRHGSN